MAITNDSKDSLKDKKAKLEDQRAFVQKNIDALDEKKARFMVRKQALTRAINNLKTDIDNG